MNRRRRTLPNPKSIKMSGGENLAFQRDSSLQSDSVLQKQLHREAGDKITRLQDGQDELDVVIDVSSNEIQPSQSSDGYEIKNHRKAKSTKSCPVVLYLPAKEDIKLEVS